MREQIEPNELLRAAERKIEMAQYHLQELVELHSRPARVGKNELPPVPIQAHFEGVLYCCDAAKDQVARALTVGLRLDELVRKKKENKAFDQAPDERVFNRLREWKEVSIVDDVRLLRNQMTHRFSPNKRLTEAGWELEPPKGSHYDGSRELRSYCLEVLTHWQRLNDFIDLLIARLGEG